MKVEAKKYTLSYDEYENDVRLLDKILKDKHLPEYKQITIGCWDYEGEDCSDLLKGILENKDKFAHIEGLFWEISIRKNRRSPGLNRQTSARCSTLCPN